MPIGAITMILTNVGLQIYNNWCGSRQNKQLQQKREEFEQAARERNTQRMWKLMREGQELTKQLEEEKHQQRLEELKNDIGSLLQKLTYAATINNWPLNVLPIVMKNQALGNLLANQEENIALHCIFTPSNSLEFNRTVFSRIEEALEAYCNQHWSVMSDHPVLFYSGAWKSQQAPTEVQIDSMRTALSNLPTLLITPFFRPNDGKLVFHIRIWGVGASSSDEFSIPEIEPTEFQRNYQSGDDFVTDVELMDELIEDVVPYLQCLIGYMTDTYFWSSLGKAPHLPLLVTNGTINTDGMKYLMEECRGYYKRLGERNEERQEENLFVDNNSLSLFDGTSSMITEPERKTKLENIFISHFSKFSATPVTSMQECINLYCLSKEDIPFIDKFCELYQYADYAMELKEIKEVLNSINFDYSILDSTDIAYLERLAEEGNSTAMFRLGEIYEYSIGVKWNGDKANMWYNQSSDRKFILGKLKKSPLQYQKDSAPIVDSLINLGIASALAAKADWLCQNGRQDEALNLLYDTSSTHPKVHFLRALIIKAKGGNIREAEKELANAANAGYIEAQELLSKWYKDDTIIPQNPSMHVHYTEMAMQQGSSEATYTLAMCYYKGYGVEKSIKATQFLLKKASSLGNKNAEKIINMLNLI